MVIVKKENKKVKIIINGDEIGPRTSETVPISRKCRPQQRMDDVSKK